MKTSSKIIIGLLVAAAAGGGLWFLTQKNNRLSASGFSVGDIVSFPIAGMTDHYKIISFTTDGTFVNILDLSNNESSQVFVSFLNSFGTKIY